MAIDPLSGRSVSEPGVSRPGVPERPQATEPGAPASSRETDAAADSVAISPQAMELAGGSHIPSGTLDPARLAAITARLADGSYDTAESRAALAQSLQNDLASGA